MKTEDIPIPESWPELIRDAMIHAASLARYTITYPHAWAANSPIPEVQFKAKLDRADTKISRLQNQLNILKSRFSRIPSQSCPHYSRFERMDILTHKAACGWNLKQTAEAFMLEPSTISSWMVDLTTVPTGGGFWTSWFPNSLPQCWPFCWWLAVIIDHFSRRVIGFAVFKKPPASKDITGILNKAIKRSKCKPKHIITDKGSQFTANHYKTWCEKKKIKPRYGAVGKYGSIAIIERFIKSLKNECTRKISAPFNLNEMQHEISLYVEWYNQYRPHSYLKARTPQEVYRGFRSLGEVGCNFPPLKMIGFKHASEIPDMKLQISYLEGRKHLPVVEFKKVEDTEPR